MNMRPVQGSDLWHLWTRPDYVYLYRLDLYIHWYPICILGVLSSNLALVLEEINSYIQVWGSFPWFGPLFKTSEFFKIQLCIWQVLFAISCLKTPPPGV